MPPRICSTGELSSMVKVPMLSKPIKPESIRIISFKTVATSFSKILGGDRDKTFSKIFSRTYDVLPKRLGFR
jgi:hypothetical protein